MSLRIPETEWQRLAAFLAAHPTCQVTLHFHQGGVRRIDLQETLRVGAVLLTHELLCGEPDTPARPPLTSGRRSA